MLARGPDASLYDAVDGLGSDVDSDSGVTAATSTRATQRESDLFLADVPDEEVTRMLEVRVCTAAAQQVEATSRKTAAAPSIPRTHTHRYTHILTYAHVCIIPTGRGGVRTGAGAAGVCPARSIRRPGLHHPAAGRDTGRAAFRPHSKSRCGDSVLDIRPVPSGQQLIARLPPGWSVCTGKPPTPLPVALQPTSCQQPSWMQHSLPSPWTTPWLTWRACAGSCAAWQGSRSCGCCVQQTRQGTNTWTTASTHNTSGGPRVQRGEEVWMPTRQRAASNCWC